MHAITGCVNLKIIGILKSKVQIHLNIMYGDVICCALTLVTAFGRICRFRNAGQSCSVINFMHFINNLCLL